MRYKMRKRSNPMDRKQEKWYASPVHEGKITKSEITKEIVKLSSLSRGDVSNTIENLIDIVSIFLKMGKSVNLGDLGTLRISFSSKGVDKPEEFGAHMIDGVRIVFTPSVELKKSIEDLKFEKMEA